ncbi:hypothetical protein MESS2_690008 [Mesorhizobium metallidurans STM 2683]|uniref:Uncharacterized protein n=1 Tax=Mesorhizobium metallidurans STM 2683 TaxID=1297569 RepID=M5F7W3_9HYPH|nr:hypothetical protein MESS2_690008 [Mesorhizobium metallidurans STM 2683]
MRGDAAETLGILPSQLSKNAVAASAELAATELTL